MLATFLSALSVLWLNAFNPAVPVEAPAPVETYAVDSLALRDYMHPLHDFTIGLPEGYVVDQKYKGAIMAAYPKKNTKTKSPIVFIRAQKMADSFDGLRTEDVRELIAMTKEKKYRSSFSRPKKVTLNGTDGFYSQATEMVGGFQLKLNVFWFHYKPNNHIYQVMVGATTTNDQLGFEFNKPIIEQIQNSFKLPVPVTETQP